MKLPFLKSLAVKLFSTAAAALLLMPSAARATVTLPYLDAFNYSEGNLISQSGGTWILGNGTSSFEIAVSNSATLTAPAGFPAATGKGVRRAPSGSARRAAIQYTSLPNTVSNTMFVSFLMSVQTPPTANELIGYLDNNSTSQGSPQAGIFVGNGVVGIGKKSSGAGFTSAIAVGTHLVVVRYTFLTGNDQVDLWIDPASGTYGAGSAPASLGSVTGASDPVSLDYFQFSTASGGSSVMFFDELRLGTAWADVVPAGVAPIGVQLGFTTQPANGAPNVTLNSVVVQVQAAGGAAVASNNVPVTLSLTSGSGTLSGTLTQNTDATGKTTFTNLTIDAAGTGKQLTATASGIGVGLTNAVSTTFSITAPAVAAKLAFTTQPTNALVNATMSAVVVQIQDTNSVAIASNNVPITLTLTAGSGALGGTTTVNSDATGKATFSTLTIDTAGTGKQFTAAASGSGAGLASAVSGNFSITNGGVIIVTNSGSLLFTQSVMAATGFITRGTAGISNIFCQILGSADLTIPATNWMLVAFQNSDADGNVTFTNPTSPALPIAYYRLRTGSTDTKLQPPAIGIQPQSLIVSPGATAVFNVVAVGPMLQYLWYFNGNPISGATQSTLTITNAQAANVGNYFVIVANPGGSVTSATATLGVGNVAPIIITHPVNETNTAGGTAIFTVAATGTATLAYQWYFNNTTPLAGKTTAQLVLNNLSTNDQGNYRCTVTNAFGTATSSNAALVVTPAPTGLPDTNILGWAAYANVTGGAGGADVYATNYLSLSNYVRQVAPLIIHVTNQITGPGPAVDAYCYIYGNNKTILGEGTNAQLNGIDLRVNATNVIIANLLFQVTPVGVNDAITIDGGTKGTGKFVWVDHCTISNAADGSIDITKGGDYVTISWCHFLYAPVAPGVVNHEFVNLIGSSDTDSGVNFHVTFHHNWYGDYARERMPSVRFGHVHCFNNYYNCAGNNYCIRTRLNAEVLAENNYFLGVQNPWERFVTTGSPGLLHVSGNLTNSCTFVNGWVAGATVIPGDDTLGADLNPPPYPYTPNAAADVPYYISTYAGHGKYPYVP